MSMSVDGVWKTGVWATTVWGTLVWREGDPTSSSPYATRRSSVGRVGTMGRRYVLAMIAWARKFDRDLRPGYHARVDSLVLE